MPEVPDSGKHHGQSQAVCRLYDLLVANRASGLDDGRCPCLGDLLNSVGEGEERI